MNKQEFKKGIQSELKSAGLSFRNPIKKIEEMMHNNCIVFTYAIDEPTKQWLQNRFRHGVSFKETDHTLCFINTPNQSNKPVEPTPADKKLNFEIQINCQLDYIETEVIRPNRTVIKDKRWTVSESNPGRETAIMAAKARCFDLLWEYTELGHHVEIHPYLN